MQTDILRVLRATAASWWRHRELRRTDQTLLAQRLERQTVLRDLDYLRRAASLPNAHVICGEGGTFLHLGWTTVSSFAPIERFPLAALAVARGTPFIDFRPATDVIAFANLPRVTDRSTLTIRVPAGPSRRPPTSTLSKSSVPGSPMTHGAVCQSDPQSSHQHSKGG